MNRCVGALLSSTLVCGALLGAPVAAAQEQESGLDVGWHVPWALGGPRVAEDGSVYQHPGEWPDFEVRSLRLWDTRTAWLNLQPTSDGYDFSNLDAQLDNARARGVEHVTLVLAGTPRWAARVEAPTDAPWLGPGSASPPRSLETWTDFVSTVVDRYAGRIDAYELGNEPNLRMFWNGDYNQLGAVVNAAAQVIRRHDPSATVVAPAPLISELRDTTEARHVWGAIDPDAVDVLAFHFYPARPGTIRSLPSIIRWLRAAARETGFVDTPLWITEANPGAATDSQHLRALQEEALVAGVDRLYWYAWMRRESLNLLEFHH